MYMYKGTPTSVATPLYRKHLKVGDAYMVGVVTGGTFYGTTSKDCLNPINFGK